MPRVMVGRPKEFDEQIALKQAMEVFWSHGYEATSVQNLVDAMEKCLDRGRRQTMGAAARAAVEGYTWAWNCREMVKVFEDRKSRQP